MTASSSGRIDVRGKSTTGITGSPVVVSGSVVLARVVAAAVVVLLLSASTTVVVVVVAGSSDVLEEEVVVVPAPAPPRVQAVEASASITNHPRRATLGMPPW